MTLLSYGPPLHLCTFKKSTIIWSILHSRCGIGVPPSSIRLPFCLVDLGRVSITVRPCYLGLWARHRLSLVPVAARGARKVYEQFRLDIRRFTALHNSPASRRCSAEQFSYRSSARVSGAMKPGRENCAWESACSLFRVLRNTASWVHISTKCSNTRLCGNS